MADDPHLQILSFAAHSARGLIQNQTTRRRLMIALLIVAVLMIAVGSSFFATRITAREHAVLFMVYWLVCGWITFTALLLALFDILLVRRDARTARKALQQNLDNQ